MKTSSKLPLLKTSALLIAACMWQSAHADMENLIGEFSTPAEQEAARALIATYNDLSSTCGNPDSNTPCTDAQLTLYNNVLALIHTANDITNRRGQTEDSSEFSLLSTIASSRGPNENLTNEFYIGELGKFLRWNSGEEYAAQSAISRDFTQGQSAGLAARLGTLRFNASGFSSTNQPSNTYALIEGMSGGGAGDTDSFSRWSGFLNYTQSSGTQDATGLEDAFDVDSGELTGGIDYRIDNNWVAGVVLGYTNQDLDFDGSKSVVDGGMESDGYSAQPFVMYQDDSFYLSISGGYQSLAFDTRRSIDYGYDSLIDSDTSSSTDATTTTLASEFGYTFQKGAFVAEPYYKNQFASTHIDAFTERDLSEDALNLAIDAQRFSTTTHSIGLKLQYTLSTSFAVFVPYTSYQLNNERHTGSTVIAARYANSTNSDAAFLMSTDENDENYAIFNIGVSSVLRGGRQSEADSASSGGLQAFINYKKICELKNYDLDSIALGIRYEF